MPIATDIAVGFDAAGARRGRAFCQAERLLVQSVYNVGDADFISRSAECITTARTTGAFEDFTLRERLQHLAYHGLPQPEYRSQVGGAEYLVRVRRHVCQ